MHRTEKGHQENVCNEIHEQNYVHQKRCRKECTARTGNPPELGAPISGESLVYLPG